MGKSDKARSFINEHKAKARKDVRDEKDLRASIKKALVANSALIRAGFEAEKAEFDAAYEDAIAGVDEAEASIDQDVDDILANTGAK